MNLDLADIISMARYRLRDLVYPYRWNDEVMIRYCNDGIKEIRRIRPDTRIGTDGITLIDYSEISMVNPWTYTSSLDSSAIMSGYEGMVGWDKHTFPQIYFNCDSSTTISGYATASDRAYDRFKLLSIVGCDSIGNKDIIPQRYKGTMSGMGGSIRIDHVAVPNNQWYVTVAANDLIIPQEIFNDMLANYVAAECLKMEWDDAQNSGKAKQFEQEFTTGIMQV